MRSAARRSVSREAVPLPMAMRSTECSLASRASVASERAVPLVLRDVRVVASVADDAARPVDDRDLDAGAEARVEAHRGACAGGRSEQQVAQVGGEHAYGLILCSATQLHPGVLADRLGPAAAPYAGQGGGREACALQAAVQPLGLLPGHQDLGGRAGLHRQRGADRDGVPQSGQPFRRRHADPHVALPAIELRALAGHVAQVREHRSRRGQQAVLAGRGGQLGQPRARG